MTSNCLNCKTEILFGNLSGDDFCCPECYREYLKKYPDFPKRGEKNRCMHCGSADIEIAKTEEKELEAGNLMQAGSFTKRKVTIESWDCLNCSGTGETMILGEKV